MQKERTVLEITKEARDNTFIDSEILGGVRIAASGTRMIRTRIGAFKKEHPVLFWASVATIVGVPIAVASLVVGMISLG
jgi:hypothetical protein